MMRSRSILCLVAGFTLAACAGTKKTTTKQEDPKPKPTPVAAGDTLRLKAKQGDKLAARGKVTIEFDIPGKAGKKPGAGVHVVLPFDLAVEQKVDSVDAQGNAQLTARLADAFGKADGMDAKSMDEYALALDELKVSMTRTARGEITSVNINGVRKPLEDRVARSIVNALFFASRGALLPEAAVEVGGKWKSETQIALGPNLVGNAVYNYNYAKKEGNVVTIASDGTVSGDLGGGKKVATKITSEYRLDNEQGRLTLYTTDILSSVEDPNATAENKPGQQRIKVELNFQ